MNHFQHMTAAALAARSRSATTLCWGMPHGDFASIGNAQQYGPSFAPGGAG